VYRHTQVGKSLLFGLAGGGAACAAAALLAPVPWIGLAVGAVLVLSAVLFGTLTVEVDGDALRFRFGPGLVARRIPLAAIREVRSVRTSLWHGWGIHLTPHGWLYNVSGFDAVEVGLEGGKRLRIGTDEPRELERAVRRAAGLARSSA
jgi:hypothetical protein